MLSQNKTSVESTEGNPTLFIRNIYPIPAKNIIQIEFAAARSTYTNLDIELFDINGVKVFSTKPNLIDYNSYNGFGTITLNLSNLDSGIMFLVIKDGTTTRYEKIFKIER